MQTRRSATRLLLLVALAALAPGRAQAAPPESSLVPGGIAVIAVAGAADPAPRAYFNGKRVLVLREGDAWHAVVGLPLALEPGTHKLTLDDAAGNAKAVLFEVRAKEYETQHLTIANRRLVEPEPRDLVRIEREQKVLEAAFTAWSERPVESLDFGLPAQGPLSSSFGLRRYFNGLPRQPHSGVDIAAGESAPVVAPAAGIVSVVGEFFFNGRTVVIDHGQGLLSMFNHLSHIDVTQGMPVARGRMIGTVGSTGRVTGPHLHWTVSLNNARVDPLLFVPPALRAFASPAPGGR